MSGMVSIGFNYKDRCFNALIRLKEINGRKEYYVTIMNGELESVFFGNHIFVFEDAQLINGDLDYPDVIRELRNCIGLALNEFLSQSFLL